MKAAAAQAALTITRLWAVCSKDATETQGDVYGFSLVYSGDFVAGVEQDAYNTARAYIGINPFEFSYTLEK